MKQLETFDEFEGIHQKCSHYIILTAARGIAYKISYRKETFYLLVHIGCCVSPLPAKEIEKDCPLFNLKNWQIKESPIQRYGQAGCSSLKGMWIMGGFGVRPQGHGRLDNLIFVHLNGRVEPKLKDKRLARMYHSLHLIQSKLVVYGGRTHPEMVLGDLGFIDTESNKIDWLEAQPAWPEPRFRHASTLISPNEIFVAGGRGHRKILSDCWIMRVLPEATSPSVDWLPFLSLPSGRHSAVASYWNELIVISGGLNKSETSCQPQLLVSKTSQQQEWTEPAWNGPLPIPRYSHQALVTTDNRLILAGGISSCHSRTPGVCVIDLQNWTSVEYSLPVRTIPLIEFMNKLKKSFCLPTDPRHPTAGDARQF